MWEEIRNWLISQGISAEELDEVIEPPVLRDIGEGLTLSLQNDDDIGNTLVMLMEQIDQLKAEIDTLKGGA